MKELSLKKMEQVKGGGFAEKCAKAVASGMGIMVGLAGAIATGGALAYAFWAGGSALSLPSIDITACDR